MIDDDAPLTDESARPRFEAAIARIEDYPGGFDGRGIVIAAGGPKYYPCAYVAIRMLRELGCALPIEVWHLGPAEMTPSMRAILEPYGVECIDAMQVCKRFPMRRIEGWELKPYAALHSRFREVMLLDADNVVVRDPTFMFDDRRFLKHGAIFWPDPDWFSSDHPIFRLAGMAYRRDNQFESGQLMVDKARCWRALAATVWLNAHSDFWYRVVYGDKDTFYIAWRKLGLDYGMPRPFRPLGSAIIQFDFANRPLFQHRICKWSVCGPNQRVIGFQREDRCIELLSELARDWSGNPSLDVHAMPRC